MKVCCTCRYWSTRYKGFCQRLNQGVGKFYHCADWTEAAGGAGEPPGANPQREPPPSPGGKD